MTFVARNLDHHVLSVNQATFAIMHRFAFQLDGREHQLRAAHPLTRQGCAAAARMTTANLPYVLIVQGVISAAAIRPHS